MGKVEGKAHAGLIIHGDSEQEAIQIPAGYPTLRVPEAQISPEMVRIGHMEMECRHKIPSPHHTGHDAGFCLIGRQAGELGVLVDGIPGIPMSKAHVPNVTGVVNAIEVVTGPVLRGIDFQDSGAIEARITPEGRWFSFAKVNEYEPEVFVGRITTDLNLFRIRLLLARLLHALSRAFVFPPMIAAPHTISLHPTRRQLSPAMGAPEGHHVGDPGLPPVESEFFTHDLNGPHLPRCKVLGPIHRLPKTPEVSPSESVWTCADKVGTVFSNIVGSHMCKFPQHSAL
jgi:hypothetical protein